MIGSLTARTLGKCLPVAVADNRRTLCGTIAYRVGELYLFQECLHLLVECSTSDDDLVELTAKGLDHLLAYLLTHFLGDDRHGEQQAHAVVLYLGEYLLADNFLDDQRYGDDNLRLHVGKGLRDDGRRRYTVEVIDVTAVKELEDEFEGHTVHVCHREN